MTGHPKGEITKIVAEASQILKLHDYLDRKPKALLDGQKQGMASGRAIMRGPDVFLFDEPLSDFDAKLLVDMRMENAQVRKKIETKMIYLKHDQV